MKKLLQRILAAFMAVFLLVCTCTPFISAVAPIALVEAALMSYVATTGFKLWVDNGTGQDVMDSLSSLYDDWLLSVSGGYLTLTEIGNNDLVYTDTSGNIIISQSAATNFQAFSDWLQSNYSVPLDNSVVSVLPATSGNYTSPDGSIVCALGTINSNYDGKQYSDLVIGLDEARNQPYYLGVFFNDSSNYSGSQFYVTRYNNAIYARTLPNSFSSFSVYLKYGNGSLSAMRNDSISDSAFTLVLPLSSYGLSSTIPLSASNPINYSGDFVAHPGIKGLALSLGQSVADVVSDIGNDESLVMDVGAAAGSSVADVVDSVVSGYDSVTGTLPVTDTVVATDVIDTPVQAYPDFDNLGLPQLGLALVERFPFCIPYDFVHLISLFDAEPVAPYIEIDLFPASFRQKIGLQPGQAVFVLDMTADQYATLGLIMRWGSLVGFCVALMFITRRLIWSS